MVLSKGFQQMKLRTKIDKSTIKKEVCAMNHFLLYFLLVIVMMIWGFNVIAIKVIVSALPTITITALRVFMAFLVLLPILLYKKEIRVLSKRELIYILGIALTGIFGHQVLMSIALVHTSAANGGLILGTVPIATTIAAVLFLKDKLTISNILGLIFGFLGVGFVLLSNTSTSLVFSSGDLYMCFVVILQALSFILIKKLSATVEVIYITGLSQFIGFMMLLILGVSLEKDQMVQLQHGSVLIWLLFLGSGLIATGLGHFLYNYAIQKIGTSKSALFLNLSPFFALVGSAIFLGEKIFVGQWIGFLFIIVGVILGGGILEQVKASNIRSMILK